MGDDEDRFTFLIEMLEKKKCDEFPDSLKDVVPWLTSLGSVLFDWNP